MKTIETAQTEDSSRDYTRFENMSYREEYS